MSRLRVRDAEGVALVVQHLDPGDLQVAALTWASHHAVFPCPRVCSTGRRGGTRRPRASLAASPHEVEEGLVAVDEHALVILGRMRSEWRQQAWRCSSCC